MIEPFEPEPVRSLSVPWQPRPPHMEQDPQRGTSRKVVSYGLGHYGYDMRVASEFEVFHPHQRHYVKDGVPHIDSPVVDPKAIPDECFEKVTGDCIIPPNSFALARSVECFSIPRDVLALVIGKSTYARCGIIVNCTPLEPEWRGHVTLEISNTTPLPARIYANEGIAQVLFFKASDVCATSYADKGGKYQDQPAQIIKPRM